jgi:TPP-dependent pyruvate/acetoin dehydrogenase alpha subunit
MTASSSRARAKKAATRSELPSSKLSNDQLMAMHRMMALIRRFEEKVIELFQEGVLPGFLHVAIGQEAIAVGVSEALRDEDYVGSTHRAHGHILARGSDPGALMAEMMGRVTGVCQGKGGSMHLADMSRNVVGANGVVGSGAPMMNGVALTQKLRGGSAVAVAYYGDGASNQGNVHEALNLAQLWKLPTVFVLENNRYAESTPYWQQVPVEDLTARAAAYDMKAISVDGNDVLAVYDAATEAVEHARSGAGPVLLVCETKRFVGHYVGDSESYRPKGEAKEWRAGDPIPRFEQVLVERGIAADTIAEQVRGVREQVDAFTAIAAADPVPAPQDAMLHVYAEDHYPGPVLGV